MYRSWADRDTVAHPCQVGESSSPGRGRRERDLRTELRGTEVLEAIMASVVIAAVALFLGGIVIGIVAVAVLGARRDSLTSGEVPGRMARSARRLNGVGIRDLDAERLRQVGELVH